MSYHILDSFPKNESCYVSLHGVKNVRSDNKPFAYAVQPHSVNCVVLPPDAATRRNGKCYALLYGRCLLSETVELLATFS